MTSICEAKSVEECSDKYDEYNEVSEERKEQPRKQVGFPIPVGLHFKWQKHADEYFKGRWADSKHPGKVSDMVKDYVKSCMTIVEKSNIPEEKDESDFIVESALDSGNLVNRKQELESELADKRNRINELENKLERVKNENKLRTKSGYDKIRYAVKIAVKDEPKTFSEISDELEEIGISEEDFEANELPDLPKDGDDESRTARLSELISMIVQNDPEIVEKDVEEVNDYLEFTRFGLEDPRN